MNGSGALARLQADVERLSAIEALRDLKARYAELADQKYTADHRRQPPEVMADVARRQAACFTPEALWDGGSDFGATLRGREALCEWFTRSPWCFAAHHYVSPSLKVDGATAEGRWRLWQLAMRDDTRETVLLTATTHERYARQPDGAWLHAYVRFEQIRILPIGAGPDALLDGLRPVSSPATSS